MKTTPNRFLSIAVLLLLVTNIVLVAFVVMRKEGHGRKEKGRSEPFEMMAKELNLTDQQKTDLKKMKEDFFSTNKSLFDSIRAAKSAFFELINQENVSDSVLTIYSRKIADIQAVADKITFAHFKRVRAALTAEQQPKYDSFVKKMMTMRGRRDSADRKDK